MDRCLMDFIDNDVCMALIPARGGSKSVPKKNIRLFQGHPMIAYSIAAAKLAQNVDRIVVTTDSEEIANISNQYGAEVPFLRPMEYAQDDSPDIDFVKHAIVWLYENEKKIPGCFVHLRPTTPIRNPSDIDKAICMIRQNSESTSLRSGSICVHPPFKWFKKEGAYLSPLMPGLSCDEVNLPRQDFPEVYIPNGYVDIIKTEYVIKTNLLHGDRVLAYRTDEVMDIDTEHDIKKLEWIEGQEEVFLVLQNYLNQIQRGAAQ